ncbi:outer membrane protein [Bradyrhizobium sp. OK095]|uniref:outer membrane protein n=1 Tax=Bradyrhizobium sp. OK095 TaxID=1882760 RepID=UPI0008D7927D|nr:outer membrane protein [Bradyrhizobium sp. OK095]SEM33042.1 outer membrane immunogenic protein [Bradyrhizobium sp. OK095]
MTRTLLVAAAIGILLAPPAFAADLAVPHIYAKAPPVVVDPTYNWSGFYAGLNIGYGWGRSATTADFIDSGGGALLSSSAGKFDLNGVTGGGQIGYNWQRDMFVVGVEADFQGSGRKGSFDALCAGAPAGLQDGVCTPGHRGDNTFDPALPVAFNLTQKLDWFGTVRGRLGVAVTPRVLFYGTGGLAYGRVSTSGSVSAINVSGSPGSGDNLAFTPVAANFNSSTVKVGWSAGAGIEGAFADNWSAKLEYLYVDLGTVSGSLATPVIALSGAPLIVGYRSHVTDNILRFGVNYRFNGT